MGSCRIVFFFPRGHGHFNSGKGNKELSVFARDSIAKRKELLEAFQLWLNAFWFVIWTNRKQIDRRWIASRLLLTDQHIFGSLFELSPLLLLTQLVSEVRFHVHTRSCHEPAMTGHVFCCFQPCFCMFSLRRSWTKHPAFSRTSFFAPQPWSKTTKKCHRQNMAPGNPKGWTGWVDNQWTPRYMVQEFEHFDYSKYKKLWQKDLFVWQKM